jgi:hypothetical protein
MPRDRHPLHLRCSSRQAPQHRLAFCSITSRTVSRPRTRVDFQSTPHEPLALQARVVQFLMGFSAELYLKSALLHSGVPSDKIFSFRHDLASLYDSAEATFLRDFSHNETLKKVIDILHPSHKGLSLRYLKSGLEIKYIKEGIAEALGALKELDSHLRKSLGGALADRVAPTHKDN